MKNWRRVRRVGYCLAGVLALAVALDWVCPPDLIRYQTRGTLLFVQEGALLSVLPASDQRLRFGARLSETSPQFLRLLLAVEDRHFYRHPGVNPLSVLRATFQLAQAGEVVSGASTISMQTVRLLEPRPRTLSSKIIEMLRALQLEMHYSKDEILTIYLTLAPYGGRVEGIEAAARLWFGKSPQHLTLADAALLVALPQSPERLRPDRFPAAALHARNRILQQALTRGLITPQQEAEAAAAPLPQNQGNLPDLARHLAERLRRLHGAGDYVTTLDPNLTPALGTLLEGEAAKFSPEVAIAALVVENATGFVQAYVGNADYYNNQRRGMVDMIPAIRSPGSTLKPFIYALAFEGLLIHPLTVMTDSPQRFSDYAPGNFDNRFHGDITAQQALQSSLNIPAVALLNRIGPVVFDNRLQEAGVTLAFNRSLGPAALPIALGGVGMSLENLVRLYGGFAQNGSVVPALRYLEDEPALPSKPFITPVAAWYVRSILQHTPRPSGFSDSSLEADRDLLAFKTGTSYGLRDAWSVGFNSRYTIGVWVGRADGMPCSECVGIQAAAPLLLRIAALLPKDQRGPHFSIPLDILAATSTDQLPPALRRFSLKGVGEIMPLPSAQLAQPLKLSFPADGSVIEIPERSTSLPLKAEGGQRPLTWFVNGAPLSSDPVRREAEWPITSEGFVHITVKDGTGAAASAEAFLSLQEVHD